MGGEGVLETYAALSMGVFVLLILVVVVVDVVGLMSGVLILPGVV